MSEPNTLKIKHSDSEVNKKYLESEEKFKKELADILEEFDTPEQETAPSPTETFTPGVNEKGEIIKKFTPSKDQAPLSLVEFENEYGENSEEQWIPKAQKLIEKAKEIEEYQNKEDTEVFKQIRVRVQAQEQFLAKNKDEPLFKLVHNAYKEGDMADLQDEKILRTLDYLEAVGSGNQEATVPLYEEAPKSKAESALGEEFEEFSDKDKKQAIEVAREKGVFDQEPGEGYPKYIDTEQTVTKKQLSESEEYKKIRESAQQLINQVKKDNKELDDIQAIQQISERIREVRHYSTPENSSDPLHTQTMDHLRKNGLSSDQMLLTLDYIEDDVARTYNESALKNWKKELEDKYGSEQARRQVLDTVSRGFEGNIEFTEDAQLMSISKSEEEEGGSREAGYQDLRATQLASDYLLDTYNPKARTEWVEDGNISSEGTRARQEYQAFLRKVITGEEIPSDQQKLANKIKVKYEEFKRLSVDDAVEAYKGVGQWSHPDNKKHIAGSIDRWRDKHKTEPYRNADLDLMLTKG
ncbi:hypothetical protein ACFL1M_03030, partial [Patescibacteria group bacterium]